MQVFAYLFDFLELWGHNLPNTKKECKVEVSGDSSWQGREELAYTRMNIYGVCLII